MHESNQRLLRLSLLGLRCAGVLTALGGGIALLGWHLGNRVLIQVHPLFAPMPYIMALGLVCLGVGYVLLDRRTSWACGAGVAGLALGIAGCLEVAGLRLGFLTPQWPGALVAPVALVAPASELANPSGPLCLLVTVAALLVRALRPHARGTPIILGVAGSALVVVASLGLFGYLTGFVMILGHPFARLSLATLFSGLALGLGLFLHACAHAKQYSAGLPHWLPVMAGGACVLIAAVLWQAMTVEDRGRHVDLAAGVVLAALLVVAVSFAQTASRRARELERAMAERHHTEVKLAQERYRLNALLETMPDSIYFKDADGRFTQLNNAMVRRLGLKLPEEALGKTDLDFFSAEYAQASRKDEEQVLRTGQAIVGREEKQNGPGKQARWLWTTRMPFRDSDGQVIGTIAISRDISEQKQQEVELKRAKDAAEAASRAKSQFLANMSHEIRTPMNGILGMTEMALETQLQPEQREYLDLVKVSADSLLTIINDILDFSKIEAGKLQLEQSPFRLRHSLANMLKPLALRAHQKGLELACDIAPELPERLVGDTGRLQQILVNLIGNAIKFTHRGLVVLRIAAQQDKNDAEISLHFAVTDTGIGIPSEKQDVIFHAFEQADGSTTRKYGGTGLGLAIASHLVEMMGGQMWVDSEVGQGTTFHFTARFALGRPGTACQPRPGLLTGLSALVVDDNAATREIAEKLLASWHMRVAAAADGPAALRLVQEAAAGTPFSCILIDTVMTGMDGFALAHELRAGPAPETPLLLLLPSPDRKADFRRWRDLTRTACLSKPIFEHEVREVLEKLLDRAPAATAAKTTKPTPELASKLSLPPGLDILLAEDNAVNQKLVVHLLENYGHNVVVVSNGEDALERLAEQHFDAVLMDVQMPLVGGLEATAHIRARENGSGRRVPIIAMTAHALKGDRERCLAAGMDAYLAKPVEARELLQTIADLCAPPTELLRRRDGAVLCEESKLPAARTAGADGAVVQTAADLDPPADVVLDRDALLRRVDRDMNFLREMVQLFDSTSPQHLDEIREALAQADATRVSRAAHTFKGSVSTFGAGELIRAISELEESARAGDLSRAAHCFCGVERKYPRLSAALAALMEEPVTA